MATPAERPEPLQAFAARLRGLRATRGNPTEQQLAQRMGCGRTTVSDLLNGRRFPTWEQTWTLVRACGISDAEQASWQREWQRAHRALDALRYGASMDRPAADGSDALAEFALAATATSTVGATWFRDNPEFYRANADQVRRARTEIRLTYVRQYPPTVFTTQASVEYFSAVLDWARTQDNEQRSVRRVIGIPYLNGAPDDQMMRWLRTHHEETADILTYEAAVVPWHSRADGLNMALFDDNVAFLAFSGGGRQKLNGFCVCDRTFTGYFIAHFEQLWAPLEPLATFLERVDG